MAFPVTKKITLNLCVDSSVSTQAKLKIIDFVFNVLVFTSAWFFFPPQSQHLFNETFELFLPFMLIIQTFIMFLKNLVEVTARTRQNRSNFHPWK